MTFTSEKIKSYNDFRFMCRLFFESLEDDRFIYDINFTKSNITDNPQCEISRYCKCCEDTKIYYYHFDLRSNFTVSVDGKETSLLLEYLITENYSPTLC